MGGFSESIIVLFGLHFLRLYIYNDNITHPTMITVASTSTGRAIQKILPAHKDKIDSYYSVL